MLPPTSGSLTSSGEASPGPEGPFCAFGEVAPSGGLAISAGLGEHAEDTRVPSVHPGWISVLLSPSPHLPPPHVGSGPFPHREPFILDINGIFYYSKQFYVSPPHPPPRALSQVVVGEGHRWAVPHTGGGGQAHSLVQDGSGEQSRLRWAILVSAGSSAGFVGRLKFKVQQGAQSRGWEIQSLGPGRGGGQVIGH